jgi:magnesium chelatase subunit H
MCPTWPPIRWSSRRWRNGRRRGGGLGPVETTMLVALPEIDGATNPTVFAGSARAGALQGCHMGCRGAVPCQGHGALPRADRGLAEACRALAACAGPRWRTGASPIVLFGFPPNAGAVGTAAYLSVFRKPAQHAAAHGRRRLHCDPPNGGRAARGSPEGQCRALRPARQCRRHVSADKIVARAPGRPNRGRLGPGAGARAVRRARCVRAGRAVRQCLCRHPARLRLRGRPDAPSLFERGFAPTHAFTTFYRWIKDDFAADVVLHFGMHGALEFMPGKQAGLGALAGRTG